MSSNRLGKEKSPYLLQHANNPVDWYPWGQEAFDKAAKEDKPIFLSIGYSTCHWCHVMEHESFEDEQVADLMNDLFVSIKVDREERPDIDNIYMTVCQLVTGHGGWPLTIIMTPEKKPFFAGTYFPKSSRGGRIGMVDLIDRVKEIWTADRDKVYKSTESILKALQQSHTNSDDSSLNKSILDTASDQFIKQHDYEYGGFGTAPKFPSPHNLIYLLNQYNNNGNEELLNMVEHTLHTMRKGGIFDHIGLGFHRYSTDRYWLLPHFEKMLYDQAMLIMAYTNAYQITKDGFYNNVAEEIIEYVLRDMTSSEGAFYSAEDADSEGEEGKFYIWGYEEIKELLPTEDFSYFIKVYNINSDGNFVDESTRHQSQFNIPHMQNNLEEAAKELWIDKDLLEEKLARSRNKLFAEREKRIHPLKDDKILTDWNGLMIAALAKAGRAFNNDDYIEAAVKAMNFILTKMTTDDGKLIHRYRDGEFDHQANLDDYAFVGWGLLELYQSTFEVHYLQSAITFTNILKDHFWDKKKGGYYFTPDYGEELLVRHKDLYDGAIPSGNSVQLNNLLTLNKLTANQSFSEYAEQIINTFANDVKRVPSAYSHFLSGYLRHITAGSEIVIVGDKESKELKEFLNVINNKADENRIIILVNENNRDELIKLVPYINDYKMVDGKPTVYVCKNYECKLPTNSLEKLKELLQN